jgi:Tfp pilus assembly protein PilW
MSRPPRTARDDAGFSLLEVIIAASLLLLATVPVYRFFDSSVKQVNAVQGMIEEQAKARIAITSLENDLRNAFTGSTTLARIDAISATSITFYAPDRATPMTLRKISYRLSGGTFQRWLLSSSNTLTGAPYTWTFPVTAAPMPWNTVVRGVTNTAVFVYKDKDNVVLNPAVAGNAALVRTVEANLQVRDPAAKTTQNPETYSITVRLRGEG